MTIYAPPTSSTSIVFWFMMFVAAEDHTTWHVSSYISDLFQVGFADSLDSD
jgi:hypothetical protein